MPSTQRLWFRLTTTGLSLAAVLTVAGCAKNADYPPWWWTPNSRVEAMLELAEVTAEDVVYDLGSGDGRIVIAAATEYGARGVGIEINPELVAMSEQKAREAQVADRVQFVSADFWHADISEATVVTLYLFEETNEKLKPILIEQLDPDARVLTYRYKIPGWTPKKQTKGFWGTVYLYALPEGRGSQSAAPASPPFVGRNISGTSGDGRFCLPSAADTWGSVLSRVAIDHTAKFGQNRFPIEIPKSHESNASRMS